MIEKWLGDDCEGDRANECARHGAGECGMVIVCLYRGRYVSKRKAVVYDVVGSLDVEGLFDLGVRCYPEVEEDENCDQRRENDICLAS